MVTSTNKLIKKNKTNKTNKLQIITNKYYSMQDTMRTIGAKITLLL